MKFSVENNPSQDSKIDTHFPIKGLSTVPHQPHRWSAKHELHEVWAEQLRQVVLEYRIS